MLKSQANQCSNYYEYESFKKKKKLLGSNKLSPANLSNIAICC